MGGGGFSNTETDIRGGFNMDVVGLIFMGADCFSSLKQNLLFCAIVVQEGEVCISIFN
jgi:hypothetical protein